MALRYGAIGDLPPHLREMVRKQIGKTPPNSSPARPKRGADQSTIVDYFDGLVAIHLRDFPKPVHEHKFAAVAQPPMLMKPRRWRFDRAWIEAKVAVEIDGKTWGAIVRCHQCKMPVKAMKKDGTSGGLIRTGGRHTQGQGYENDCEKRLVAMSLGWLVVNVTASMLRNQDGSTFFHLRHLLIQRWPNDVAR